MLPSVRILTPCTARKTKPALLTPEKVREASSVFRAAWRIGKNISDFNGLEMVSAAELYSGLHHVRVMQGVREYRSSGGSVEVAILSAGYGLVPEKLSDGSDTLLVPYDATFSGMQASRISRTAQMLDIPGDVMSFLTKEGCDVQLVLLGSAYLKACGLPEDMKFPCPTYFLSAPSARVPDSAIRVPLDQAEARRFSSTLVSLKGVLARAALRYLAMGRYLPGCANELLDELERSGVMR